MLSPVDRLISTASSARLVARRRILRAKKDHPAARIRFAIFLVTNERQPGRARRSSNWLGAKFGLDHSTVLYGIGKARDLARLDPAYDRLVEKLRQEWRDIYGPEV